MSVAVRCPAKCSAACPHPGVLLIRRELRLHHALARILDGDEPLSAIAAATGFASQSHLTNLFRARFRITPGRARTRDGRRALATGA